MPIRRNYDCSWSGNRRMTAPESKGLAERRWGVGGTPLPKKWIPGLRPFKDAPEPPFDFSARMRTLCRDIADRCPTLGNIDPALILIAFTASRSKRRTGLLARVTPLRTENGATLTRRRGTLYRIQRYLVDGIEQRYILTFCLPRFLNQTFEQKLITVFHELYHIGPEFDGDLRRHAGRCRYHTHSKTGYDAHMADLVQAYLAHHPDPALFHFLHSNFEPLWRRHGGIYGVCIPQPKLIPVPKGERIVE